MRRIYFFSVCVLLSVYALAQHPGGYGEMNTGQRAQRVVEKIGEKISFSIAVKDSLLAIFTEFYDDVKTYSAYQDEKTMAVLEQTRDAQVQVQLADDKKYQDYLDFMKEMKERRKQRREQHNE